MNMRRTLSAVILIVAVFGSAILYAQSPIAARPISLAAPIDSGTQPVRLLVGRSTIVDVGTPIARVSLTSADIADAVVTAPAELLLNGKMPGTISMFVWDKGGTIRRYEVSVQRDLARLEEQIHQIFPDEKIEVRANGKNIVLSGVVSSKDAMEKLTNLAAGFVESRDEVVSLLQLAQSAPSNQVLLRVRFAEVSRSALTQLGVGLFTSATGIDNTLGRVTTEQFPSADFSGIQFSKATSSFGSDVTSAQGQINFSDFLNLFLFNEKYDIGAVVKALQTRGLFQSLAEPNVVAESGKEASFLAGGEYPVPVPQPSGGGVAITIAYKEYGIRLTFTPVVNGNRVHLKLKPEVSTLDFGNAVVLQGFRIPALTTRRTETELELNDHQTFAIAGLLNNQMTKTLQKIPGIGDIPILGLLFQSKAAEKDQTELVVMITPEILPLNSPGVTTTLPRIVEPYLPPVPQKQSIEPPPAAFTAPAASSQAEPAPATPAAQAAPAPRANASRDPKAAAAAVRALSPVTQPPNVHVDTSGNAVTSTDATAAGSVTPQTVAPKPAAQPASAAPSSAAIGTKQSAADAKKQKAEAERQAKLAREQAERDAEAEKKAHQAEVNKAAADREAAKKQAEKDKETAKREEEARQKRDKAIAEAQAKIRAAEGVFQQETANKQADTANK